MVNNLNISRIILFAALLLMMHVLIGTFIPDFEQYKKHSDRIFWEVTGYMAQAVVQTSIFMRLARLQARLLYVHVICVFALCELLGFAVLFVFAGHLPSPSTMEIVFDYSVLALWALVGTEIGRRLRIAVEKKAGLTSRL